MAMKYRQRGYRDSERDDRDRNRGQSTYRQGPPPADRSSLSAGERAQQRSLKHALERNANEVIRCPSCGRNAHSFGIGASENRCNHCGASLHCCRACRHFDSSARWECRKVEGLQARVADKTAENSCRLYEPLLVLDATGKRQTAPSSGNDPKSQFDSLFKR